MTIESIVHDEEHKRLMHDLCSLEADLKRTVKLLSPESGASKQHKTSSTHALAESILALRQRRSSIFARALGTKDLFGEPAWDILLDLYVAAGQGKQLSISSVCIGTGVPATTALRWIGRLVDLALVRRYTLPGDGRRIFLDLTTRGEDLLLQVLDHLQ